jgi:hypothetical protein
MELMEHLVAKTHWTIWLLAFCQNMPTKQGIRRCNDLFFQEARHCLGYMDASSAAADTLVVGTAFTNGAMSTGISKRILAIVEAKARMRSERKEAIQMQVASEMLGWLMEDPGLNRQ